MGSNIKHPTIALNSKSLETFISSPSYNALEDHRIGYNFAQKDKNHMHAIYFQKNYNSLFEFFWKTLQISFVHLV